MTDKSELLGQLKIDRTTETASGLSVWTTLFIAVGAAILGGMGALWWFAPGTDQAEVAASAQPEPARKKSTSSNAVAAPVDNSGASDSRDSALTDNDQPILNASGYVTARRIATVSSEIAGLITEVNVEEGMQVEQGQILARLDDAVAQVNRQLAESQLAVQRAQLQSTEASLREAERVHTRANELRKKSLTSEADLTSTAAQVESLQAQLASATASISVAEFEVARQKEHLSNHIVRAPFAGVVTVKNAQTGEIVSPGSAGGGFTRTGICTIVDMDSLEIEVDVNESFIGRVFSGQQVEANLDAYPNWKIPASVIAIIPTADRAKATVKVRISIDVKDSRILPDMGVKVAFFKT